LEKSFVPKWFLVKSGMTVYYLGKFLIKSGVNLGAYVMGILTTCGAKGEE
jgi:hypothetical protein